MRQLDSVQHGRAEEHQKLSQCHHDGSPEDRTADAPVFVGNISADKRAIFILFLTQALLFDKEHAASIYGSYTGLVYLTPLIGGYIADKYWGIRRSVFWWRKSGKVL